MKPGNLTKIRKSVATKLLMVVFSLYLIIAVLVTVGHLFVEYYYQKDNIIDGLVNIQKTFEHPLSFQLWNLDNEALDSTVVGMLEVPDIVGVKIRNEKGELIAVSGIISDSEKIGAVGHHVNLNCLTKEDASVHANQEYQLDVFEHTFPIGYHYKNETKKLGTVSIYSNTTVIFNRLKSQIILLVLNAFIKTFALWVIFLWCSYYILRKPLSKLANATEEINLDNLKTFKVDIGTKEKNELKTLEESINSMTQNLYHSIMAKDDAEKAQRDSEQKFQAIFNQTFQFIGLLDTKGTLLEANDTALNAFQVKQKDVIGKPFWKTVWWDNPPELQEQIHQAVTDAAEGEFVRFEVTHLAPDGTVFNTDFSLKPILDDDGRVSMLIPECRDITPLKEAFQALEQSENNLNITLDSIGDAVIATDAEGKIVRINPVAVELTGWKAGKAIGEQLDEVFNIIDPKTEKKAEDPVSKVIRKGKIITLSNDTVLLSKDGKRRQIADSGAPIRNENGEIVGVVLVFRDVTEEYALQEQLRQSQKMDAIGQLAGGVAHDFNNLLTAIMGNAQLLTMGTERNSEDTSIITDIIKASNRASDLTRQLLDFSRKSPRQNTRVCIEDILEEMMGILSHSIDRRITIKHNFNSSPDTVIGDSSQLQNAFLNIGVNARDAMPDGGTLSFMTRNVKLTQKECNTIPEDIVPGEFIEITVSDTGEGIDPETIKRIFDPFFTTKAPGKGTGLGLASVYGCICSHGGNIKVVSNPGKGTTFTILLPCKQTEVDELRAGNKNKIFKGEGNLLVIDDESFVLHLVEKSLTKLGYNVHCCSDGVEGLEYFRDNFGEIDLVILDMIMPKLSGEDTFTLMKELDSDVKVMILSGFSNDKVIDNMLKNGATGFLPKPFNLSDISKKVAECIGGA